MKLILSTHNVTLTKAIEDHVMGCLDKLEHIDRWAINARVILEQSTSKSGEKKTFRASIRLMVPGPDLFAEDTESDLYAAIDLVSKKMEQQIRKRQGKFKARKQTASAGKKKRQEKELS